MKIIPLSEGKFTVDKTKHFIPFNEEKDKLNEKTTGSLLVEIQPFLVITSKDILLFDTGLGFEQNDKLQLHQNIINAGINPSEITRVLLSHLHKDHAGGISEKGKLSFPEAYYYIQQKELSFALEKGSPSYNTEVLNVLKNSKQVILLDGNGVIDDYIRYEMTGAHSPYHQVFWIKEDSRIVFFGGDEAPQLQQMKHRFVAKYDFDGKQSMELRKSWWEKGEREKWAFLFYHDVKTPCYQF
ncbi:MAG: MBL fold metallo-hydrolase [Sphingobacteriales bacterium]|nr:MBL fold metallo-hydrolase [Sphingobacteriales bacterium]